MELKRQHDVADVGRFKSTTQITPQLTNLCSPKSRKIFLKQPKPFLEVSSRYSEVELSDRPLSALSFITKRENDEIISKEVKRKLSKNLSKIRQFQKNTRPSNIHTKLTIVGDLVKQIQYDYNRVLVQEAQFTVLQSNIPARI